MNPKRIKQRLTDFENVLTRLDEALKEDISKSSTIVDGTIQRFEFSFELAWKLAKDILNYNGVEVTVPRMVIKEAFQKDIIKDGESWIQMLEDRNITTHIYDQEQAMNIYVRIKEIYYPLLEELKTKNLQLVENLDS